MKVRLRTNILLGGSLVAAFLLLVMPNSAKAATSTVRGVGWFGDNFGEVYFNCLDDKLGDRLDDAENLYKLPEPRGFHFYSSPCQSLVHGVYIDSNHNFSGKAWNPTKGLISFSGPTTPPDGYGSTSSNCDHTCNASNGCWACYKESNQHIYGWARVDADGTWIRLDSDLTVPVSLKNCDSGSYLPGTNLNPGDFVGNASSSLAYLSFNCQTEPGGDMCSTRNYKVYIGNLTVGRMSAPNWSYSQACSSGARGATLSWCRESGTQTAYELAVSTGATLNTSTAVCWSGKKYSSFASQYNLPNSDPTCGSLAYNSNYYWWIRLFDESDQPTDWYQYDNNSGSDTDGNPDNNALTFTTFRHEFPSPYFVWSPYQILVGATTTFSGTSSKYYTSGAPSAPVTCVGPNCSYLWTTTDPGAIIGQPTSAITTIIFDLSTTTTVSLRVTDTDNYFCSTSSAIKINYGLPIWREIKAQ